MNKTELLALFDREMRIETTQPGAIKEMTPEVVRFLNRTPPGAWVLYAWLTEENIARVIEEQIAYFAGLQRNFEWKVYGHDWPLDLKERLARRGFEVGTVEALLALDLTVAPESLFAPTHHDVHLLTSREQFEGVAAMEAAVWGEPYDSLADQLAGGLADDPENFQVYGVYTGGQIVSAAWVQFHAGSQFASLWGGSTLPAYRGQGIYRALVAARAREARRRGYRYLTVDASPMSRPILERLGFALLTFTYPCEWNFETSSG